MSEVVILRGVPASGKSTYAKDWVLEGTGKRARLSRDVLRYGMFNLGHGVDEMFITKIMYLQLESMLEAGYDVVVDNTNLRARNVKDILKVAAKYEATVDHIDFHVTKEEAHERNNNRKDSVSPSVIDDFFAKFIGKNGKFPPFPELASGTEEQQFPLHNADRGLPKAIIVDVDGTLAHHGDRDIYDGSRAIEDRIDSVVLESVMMYNWADYKIIVMSGRGSEFRKVTQQWLAKHLVPYDKLHMRQAGDQRKDSIVKNELFEEHVAPHYDVKLAIDDRNQVVDMWRAKGIKTFQVAPGDF